MRGGNKANKTRLRKSHNRLLSSFGSQLRGHFAFSMVALFLFSCFSLCYSFLLEIFWPIGVPSKN